MSGHLLFAFLALLLWAYWPRRATTRGDPFDDTVTHLTSDIPLSGRTLANGVIWVGGVGSGKTTAAAHMLVDMLRAGYSALLLTVKIEEPAHLEALIRMAGVDVPIIRIGREHLENSINVVSHTWIETKGSVEAIAQLFEALMLAVAGKDAAKEDATARFFSQMGLTCVKHSTVILSAYDPDTLSFTSISDHLARGPGMRYILAPRTPEERAHVEAFKTSAWWKIKEVVERKLEAKEIAPERVKDLENAIEFYLTEYANMPEKQRASIVSTVTSMTSAFGFYPIREMLATKTTIDPKMLEERQCIWLLTDPTDEGVDRRLSQLGVKFVIQAQARRRDTDKSKQRVLIWADEYPQVALTAQRIDSSFQAIARQKLYCQVLMCQNFAQLKEAFGGEDQANDFLSNVRTRICMAVDEPWTQKWFADLLGKTIRILPSPQHHHPNKEPGIDWWGNNQDAPQWHSQMDYSVMPHEFGSLVKGGPPDFQPEAIVYVGGSKFADGKTYARVRLDQLI